MLEVVDLKIDGHRGEVGRLALHVNVVDIAVMLGDDLGDLRERARLVDGLQGDAGREPLRCGLVVHVPAQIEPALGRVLEGFELRRLNRVDGDALAGRQNADDAIARDSAPNGREANRQVGIDAADRDRAAAFLRQLELDGLGTFQPEPAALGPRLLRHRGDALFLVIWVHGARDVGGAHLATTDRRHHVLDRGARKPRQRALQFFVRVDDLGALAQALDDAPPEPGILVAYRGAGRAPDGGA